MDPTMKLLPSALLVLFIWPALLQAGERDQKSAKTDHWAFQAPKRSAPPPVKDKAWIRNGIDPFILARLERENLTPSPQADRVTLIRRLSLDLTGLPPTLHAIDEFLKDARTDAYERLVDRLLASPHYGERWGRHWLDLARYADSNGFNIDAPRSIWPYRDWVIAAFNRDLPFNRFVIEQLAGDLLPGATIENKIATGFHRNTLLNQEGGIDLEQFRVESVVDRVNTTGAVFLGLTLGCAQCHNHKFDPVSQREYYELFAFFNQCDEPALALPTLEEARILEELRRKQGAIQKALKGLDRTSPTRQAQWERDLTPEARLLLPSAIKDILDKPDYQRTGKEKQILAAMLRNLDQIPQFVAGLGDPLAAGIAGPVLAAGHLHFVLFRSDLEQKLTVLNKQRPIVASTLVLQERKTPRETHVHIKGDFLRKGKVVGTGTPKVLHPFGDGTNANRLDLARWLVAKENPLTARVFVNRVWQHYFGLGLVETENDFGSQGTPPSHPELLDWLALEFMSGASAPPSAKSTAAWSIKALHRLIATSATYRQASMARREPTSVDPRNRLLARQNRLRLEAEIVRDVALAASGLLHPKIGGPSVFPPQPDGVFAFTQIQREWKAATGPERHRRGLYTHFWRSAPHPALMAFDAPDSTSTCTRRNRSNTPLQALTLLNDKAFYEFAQGLAVRVLKESKESSAERLTYAFRLCLAREPSAKETRRLTELLSSLEREFAESRDEARKLAPEAIPPNVSVPQAAAWTVLSRVLLNLDEFITRE
ncbi:MAG: DUF1553 domain-containing protein [Planctomycetes bacterium]|nr:DUF1553 domain-containing protein [Planctomycetota bacterium]